MPHFLSSPFDCHWQGKDPFQEAFTVTGKVYRELESRRTLRFELNGVGYFVKLHYGLGWWTFLCEWLKGTPPIVGALTEFRALNILEKIGVHTLVPIAYGVKGKIPPTQQSFLITKELHRTVNLEDFCRDWPMMPPCPALKRALISEVADIVRKMHTAGLNHRDCYLVHFLLHTDSLIGGSEFDRASTAKLKISLIDLHRAQIRTRVPQRWRNKDLAALSYSSSKIGLSLKDQYRFLKAYFQRSLRDIFLEERLLLDFLHAERKRLTSRWDRKFSENALKKLAIKKGAWINPDYLKTLAKEGITEANAFDYFWNLRLENMYVPNTGRGGLSEVHQTYISGVPVHLKRQTMHLKYSITAPFGEPTFAHEFRSLQRAHSLGIPTPKVIYYGRANLPGKPKCAIVVVESLLPAYRSFSDVLTTWKSASDEMRLAIMRRVGVVVARLHAANFTHNCLYPKHIFIAETPTKSVQVALIDFEKMALNWLDRNKKQDLDRLYRRLPKLGEQEIGVSADEWQALLLAYSEESELDTFSLPNFKTLRLVKKHRVLPKKRITAKAFIDQDSRPLLAKIFLGSDAHSRAQAEVAGLTLLKNRGIPCPFVISQLGLNPDGVVLLISYLVGSDTLSDRLGKDLDIMATTHAEPSTNEVYGLLSKAIRLVGELHRAGLIHSDLHFANLLFQGEKLYILDGDAICETQSLVRTKKNLAAFFAQLHPSLDHFQQQLLSEYMKAHPAAFISDGALAKNGFSEEINKIRNLRCVDFLSKTLRNCTLFAVTRSFMRFSACARENAGWLEALIKEPDTFMQAEIIKRGNTCTVARSTVNGHRLVIKRYNIKNVWHMLVRFWRPSRAWHSWIAAHRLRFWGIRTPKPIALIEERIGPFRRRAWFVSEEAEGRDMAAHIARLGSKRIPDTERQDLHELFRQLQARRISHGDMKATNFIWEQDHWCLVDLDSVCAHNNDRSFYKAWSIDQNRFSANWGSDRWY